MNGLVQPSDPLPCPSQIRTFEFRNFNSTSPLNCNVHPQSLLLVTHVISWDVLTFKYFGPAERKCKRLTD